MRKKRKTKPKELKVIFKQAEGVSKEEIQRRLNAVFNILFNEVAKKKK
ncbi:MAG: hypothetical protein HYT13_02440 [Candidatus Liptonbacteria bacterium]|nr:hypothetical protein [Candidatus Liptonbacteria bacterium]